MKIQKLIFFVMVFVCNNIWSMFLVDQTTIEIKSSMFRKFEKFKDIYVQDYPSIKNQYVGIFVKKLIKKIPFCKKIKIICEDKFEVELKYKDLEDCERNKSCPVILYDKYSDWPKKSKYGGYVGKYYLGWVGKNSPKVPREMWGWNVKRIACINNEDEEIKLTKQEKAGKEVYIKNCNGCHGTKELEMEGIGTNLIFPLSPLEYFSSEEIFKKFVRNPQSIRGFKEDRMIGFSKNDLSNEDLELIIIYLKKLIEERKKQYKNII